MVYGMLDTKYKPMIQAPDCQGLHEQTFPPNPNFDNCWHKFRFWHKTSRRTMAQQNRGCFNCHCITPNHLQIKKTVFRITYRTVLTWLLAFVPDVPNTIWIWWMPNRKGMIRIVSCCTDYEMSVCLSGVLLPLPCNCIAICINGFCCVSCWWSVTPPFWNN